MRSRFALALAVVVALPFAMVDAGKPPPPPASIKTPSRDEYVAIAERTIARFLVGQKPAVLSAATAALAPDQVKPLALQWSSKGAVLVASARPEGLLLAAAAARAKPDDPIIANTFGIALSRSNQKQAALEILLRARELAPHSPLVLTNLGVVYFVLGDRGLARMRLGDATRLDRAFCPAWNAMSILELAEGHLYPAVAAYLQSMPCSTIKMRKSQLQHPPAPPKDPPPPSKVEDTTEDMDGGGADDAGTSAGKRPADASLPKFRAFPDWPSVEAMAASTSYLDAWQKETEALLQRAQDDLSRFARTGMASVARQREALRAKGLSVPEDDTFDIKFAVDQNGRYYDRQFNQLDQECKDRRDAALNKMSTGVTESLARMERALSVDPERNVQAQNTHCREARNVVGVGFAKWRNEEKACYERRNELLIEYVQTTRRWISRVAADDQRAFLDAIVANEVWAKATVPPRVYGYAALGFSVQLLTPLGRCGKGDLPHVPQPAAGKSAAAEPTKKACPFPPHTKLQAGADIGDKYEVSVAVEGCEAAEIEARAQLVPGISVAGTIEHETSGSTTLLIGGIVAAKPVLRGAGAEGGPEIGWRTDLGVTFDANGHLEKIIFRTGPEASAGGGLGHGPGVRLKSGDSMTFTILENAPEPPEH